MDSSSKRPKICIDDRISGLPDAIVSHILSFLPTRNAVKTCILSHRWKNIWSSVPNLDLWAHQPNLDKSRSAGFVDRVLLFRGSPNIHRFRLHCYGVEDLEYRIDAWICTAIRRNVVELQIFLKNAWWNSHPELPRSLFTCNTLEVLRLSITAAVASIAPNSNFFPILKYLHVTFQCPKVDIVEKLFSSCPALEELIIDGEILGRLEQDSVLNIMINAPKLKRLRISLLATAMDVVYWHKNFLKANVPNLENFDLRHNVLEGYLLKNAKSLKTAEIDLGDHGEDCRAFVRGDVDRIHRLLAGIINVKYLSISAPILGDPAIEYQSLLPKFMNLKHLGLRLSICSSWTLLANLLKMSSNLEYLAVQNNIKCTVSDMLVQEWCAPDSVPACLLSCLKTICIRGFEGRPDEMEVAEYLLKHGEVSDKLTIYTGDFRKELMMKSWEKFSNFQKGSKTSRIEWIL